MKDKFQGLNSFGCSFSVKASPDYTLKINSSKARRRFLLLSISHPIILLLAVVSTSVQASILPTDRQITWNPGVPGGIPNRTTLCANVKTGYGARGDGTGDDTSAIQQAINNCPAGQVVFIPEGTYRISGISINKGITLRGAGPDKTRLEGYTSSRAIIGVGTWSEYASGVSVTSGLSKGSTQITVNNATGYSVGDIIEIDQLNDPSLVSLSGPGASCTWGGRDNNTRALGQMLAITAKNGNTLTISPALYYNYSPSYSPEIVRVPTSSVVKYAGIEDLNVKRTTQGGLFNFEIQSAAYIWIRGVDSSKVQGRHISLGNCFRCEVRDSLVHEAYDYNSGANAYGINFASRTSDSLVENCITYTLNGGIDMESAGPGNVAAYNFVEDPINGQNLNWLIPDLGANHCAHPWLGLFEGNHGSMMSADSEHGSSSHHVFFRNYLDMQRPRQTTQNRVAALFWAYNRYMSVVGNILGHSGITGEYEAENSNCSSGTAYIYKLGYTSDGDCGPSGNDPQVRQTLYRHGNFDYVTRTTQWDINNPDHILPASLYRATKPSYFGDIPWPPIGPDVVGYINKIPAERCYDILLSGGKLANCYTNNTTEPAAPRNLRISP